VPGAAWSRSKSGVLKNIRAWRAQSSPASTRGNVERPWRRSSLSVLPCFGSARMEESRATTRSRSEGKVSLSQCSAWTMRMAGRPAQYSLLGAVCLKSILSLSS